MSFLHKWLLLQKRICPTNMFFERVRKMYMLHVILSLYTEFQCPTLPGTVKKVCAVVVSVLLFTPKWRILTFLWSRL